MGFIEETLLKRAVDPDYVINFDELYYVVWEDNGEIQMFAITGIFCTICKLVVGAIISAIAQYYLVDRGGILAVETWLLENIICPQCDSVIDSNMYFIDIEYAPACGICFSTNNMGWNNGWYCTACNYN